MARNVELKARAADLAAVRARVASLGASGPEALMHVDTFFSVPIGRLKLREFGDGTGELIAYSRPDIQGPKVSTYARSPIVGAFSLGEVLRRALPAIVTVRKRRSVFLLGQTRIHLDEVEGLGSFVELEVVLRDEQPVADGERIAATLMESLAIAPADLVAKAYADLLTAS